MSAYGAKDLVGGSIDVRLLGDVFRT